MQEGNTSSRVGQQLFCRRNHLLFLFSATQAANIVQPTVELI
jgi:hypothetical protein